MLQIEEVGRAAVGVRANLKRLGVEQNLYGSGEVAPHEVVQDKVVYYFVG